MTTRPSSPSAAAQFVGRSDELGALDEALQRAGAGRGGVVLLAGEPGIGKTRLADELGARAAHAGALVLWGRCYEGAGAPAFWPWVQIVRAYLLARSPAELRSEVRAGAADLAALAPEVHDSLPETQPAQPIAGEQARFRLFDSLTSTLLRAAQRQPLLLILDDLHWADEPSLLLLTHAGRAAPESRILILGSYRESEIASAHPLTATIAGLARLDSTLHLSLAGLAAAEITQLIAQTTSWSPSDALLAALMDATAGNPFFVAQLARLLAQAPEPAEEARWRTALPPGVRAVITQRLQRLSPLCQQLLQVAAVVGREFSLRALHQAGAPPAASLDALGEAVHAHLIGENPAALGSYRFIHALVRETLYDALPPAERVRLHRQVGATLEAIYASKRDEHLAELAYHFFQAAPSGDVATALEYSAQAARRSCGLLAFEDAALHYSRALQLIEIAATDDALRRCDLLIELGAVQARSGATQSSRATYEQAAALARLHADPPHLAQAALGLAGSVVTPGVSDERVIALLGEALAALGTSDSAPRAYMLGRLAMEYRYSPFRERRDVLSAEAVAVARRLEDAPALAAALQARHYALLAPDTLDQRMSITIELGHLADASGNREIMLQSMPWRVADLLDLGHVQAADAAIAETAQLAAALRQPLYAWYVAMFEAQRALMRGQLAEAERLVEAAHRLGQQVQPRVSRIYYAAQLFVVRREQGRLPELLQLFLDILSEYPGMPIFRCFLAHSYLQAGQAGRARALFDELSADRCAALPWDQLWLGSVVLLAELCVALAAAEAAPMLYDLLRPYPQRNIMVGVPICFGAAALCLGMLAELRGDQSAATGHFDDALAMNAKLGIQLFLAHTQVAYAALLQRTQQHERAAGLLALARAAADIQALPVLAERIAAAQASASPAAHGLTARELTALRLLAQGKSTKQIAATMAVGVSTVERHITNLYAKIGARSRADATAFALRHQLL